MQSGKTALHLAIEHASADVVQALRRNGAKFSAKDGKGDTGLHHLARCRRTDLLKFEDGVDWRRAVRIVNRRGEAPLHVLLQVHSPL